MSETSLEILPASPYAPLVTLMWGTHILRYCRWTEDLAILNEEEEETEIYTHEPSLKVIWDKPQHGGAEDSPITIQMRSFISPFDKMVLPFAHAPVTVVVGEISPDDLASRRTLYEGRIKTIIDRPDGQGRIARAQVVGHKARLDKACGNQALSTCDWIFGSEVCGYDLAANTIAGTITALSVDDKPNRVIVDVDTGNDMQNDRWARGYITDNDGLRITTRRSFDDGAVTMDLREIPPPEWLGLAVSLAPGCNKSIEVCRLHDREESFHGLAIAAPFYNPTILIG